MAVLRNVMGALASVLFAAPCRICERPLLEASRIPICKSCLSSFAKIGEPLCDCCGRPSLATLIGVPGAPSSANSLCRFCRARTYAFTHARSWAAYGPELTSAIMLLKYDEVTGLGDWFSGKLAGLYGDLVRKEPEKWKATVIVPVPLHSERRRERGYNQVELIARPLAKRTGLPLRPYLLARTKPRPPRLVLSRREHWDSVRGAYETTKNLRVDGLRILLVDDVMTTGATLDACSRALKKAGASEVLGLTVARVIPRWQFGASATEPAGGPAKD